MSHGGPVTAIGARLLERARALRIAMPVCPAPAGAEPMRAAVPVTTGQIIADPAQAQPGSYFRTALRVGHGCDGQATTAIRVRFPAGIVSASPQAKTGWQIGIERRKLEKPVAGAHGKMTDSEVSAVSWSHGILPADQFDDFGLVVVIPQTPGAKLWLPVEPG